MIKDGSSWDVVVVGAGPGGSRAAKASADAGARTLLLEKRRIIGSPVRCAEGMTWEMFKAIGMEPRPEWVANTFRGAKLISPSGNTILIDSSGTGHPCGWALDREKFDMDLSVMAAEAGAGVFADTTVTGMVESGDGWELRLIHWGKGIRIHARVVVAADGFESQVGRWAGLDTLVPDRDVISSLEYTMEGIKGDHEFMEFYFDHDVAPGAYAWVFWKGPGIANVGVGVAGDRLKDPGDVVRYLEGLIAKRPDLTGGRVVRKIAGGIPVSKPLKRTVGRNILLVGDAARVTDPMHGGGIVNAMLTGEMAGGRAAEYAGSGDTKVLEGYEAEWRGALEHSLYKHYIIKEQISRMSNGELDAAMGAMSDVKLDSLDPSALINDVIDHYPKVVKRLLEVVSK